METRNRIIGASVRLFAERGYEGVGVQEIVEAAGVTKPTLYHHFGNKRGLLTDICGRIQRDFASAPVEPYSGDLPRTLTRAIAAVFAFAARFPVEMRLVVTLLNAPPQSEAREVVGPLERGFVTTFETLFARASEDHGNMRGRHVELSRTLVAVLTWYALRIADGEIEPGDDLAFRVMHTFSHGIYS